MMKIAVFDFDGTLVYAPSSLIWTRDVPIFKRIFFPFTYLLEKLTKKSSYQKRAFEWLIGLRVSETAKVLNKLSEVTSGVKKFKEFQSKGYRIIVMSFSPAFFIKKWLKAHGLKAEVICPDIIVNKKGVVEKVSDDWVTEMYLKETVYAKKLVLEKLHISPFVSVGDNTIRDKLCDNYIDITKLQPNYKHKIIQGLNLFFR